MGLSGAWILFLASYLIAVGVGRRTGSPALLWSFVVVVTALHAVSLWNVIAWPIPGAQWDAASFHRQAAELALRHQWPVVSIGTKAYEAILVAVYRVFGADRWVGQSLSVLISTLSLLILYGIAKGSQIRSMKVRCGVILLAGLFPPFLFHGALTFREPFELIGLMGGTYFVLKACREARFVWLFPASLAFLFMGSFHHVLLAVCFVLISLSLILVLVQKKRPWRQYAAFLALPAVTIAIGVAVFVYVPATHQNNYFKKIQDKGGLVAAISDYREEVDRHSPRTTYDVKLRPGSVYQPMVALSEDYFRYLFKPYVTDIQRPVDLVAFAASAGRMLLLVLVVLLAIRTRHIDIGIIALLSEYLVVTAVWSLGTTNYGQAFRHHSITDWMLVVLAAVYSAKAAAPRRGAVSSENDTVSGPDARRTVHGPILRSDDLGACGSFSRGA